MSNHSNQKEQMNSLISKWSIAVAILITCSGAFATTAPHGLVLYTEPPNNYVETLEFVSITTTNAVIATAVLPTGAKQEIPRGGIIAIINYPPASPTESLPQEGVAALRSIQSCRAKYPQFSAKLDAAQSKWAESLEFYRQLQRASKTVTTKSKTSLTLEVHGVTYSDVVLQSFDGTNVGISHSAGVARIDALFLKPEQIVALNATSKAAQIDPAKIVASVPTHLAEAKDAQSTAKLAASEASHGSGSKAITQDEAGAAGDNSSASLGDSKEAFIRRYGKPVQHTVLNDVGTYADEKLIMNKNGFGISVFFFHDKATGIIFMPTLTGQLTAEEVKIILNKNSAGQDWSKNDDPLTADDFAFVRTDGHAFAFVTMHDRDYNLANSTIDRIGICSKEQANIYATKKKESLRIDNEAQQQQRQAEEQRKEVLRKRAEGL
jgi:hypothetical protein